MRTDTTSATSAIFAANRAQGAVTFDVHQVDGVTRRRHLHESGSLRVRFPSPETEGLSAVFVNTAGGVAFLTVWPSGSTQPAVSTLNDGQGQILANAAIVPAGTSSSFGAVSVFNSGPRQRT